MAAGILLALPFHAGRFELLAGLVAPVPWLLLAASSRVSFLAAWLGGATFVGAGLWWLNAVHPISTLACGLYFGAYCAAGTWGLSRLAVAGWPLAAAAPLAVLAYETLVQRFALFESTWLAFGTLAWRAESLAQVASVGGVSILSACIWAFAGALADTVRAVRTKGWPGLRNPALAGLLALPLAWGAGAMLVPDIAAEPLLRLALVQGNVAQSVRNRPQSADAIVQQHAGLTLRHVPPGTDLVAWPESTASLPLERDEEAQAFLSAVSRRAGAPLLVGAIGVNEGDAPSNSAFLVDEAGLAPGRCDKRCLVPGAETLLLLDAVPALRERLGDFLSRTLHFRPYLKRGTMPIVMHAGGVPFGALICYDDVVPEPAAGLRAAGAEALVTITNEAWFGRGELRQHLAIAAFRCIETRLPMARCGNDGLTCLIDPAGRVTAELPAWTEGVLSGALHATPARPIPPIVRAISGWSSVAGMLLALLVTRRRSAA